MGSGHGVHVVDFAVRTSALVIWASVPTGEASFHQDWFCIGGNPERVFLRWWYYGRSRFICGSRIRGSVLRFGRADGRRRWNIDLSLFVLAAASQQERKNRNQHSDCKGTAAAHAIAAQTSGYLRGG